MNPIPKIILICAMLTLLSACSTRKGIPSFKPKNLAMTLQKGSCLGKCAVYTLSVYSDKYALYEGRYNTDKVGKYYKLLSDSVYRDLTGFFNTIQFVNMDSVYRSDIADFPSVTIGYHLAKKPKYVTFKENRPDELVQLQRKLEQVANSFDWIPMQKNKEKLEYTPVDGNRSHEDGVNIKTEIIMEPVQGVSMDKWLERYQGYGVKIKEKIAPNFAYYLLTWDMEIISADDMLQKIRLDSEVKSAEFNKKIMTREH